MASAYLTAFASRARRTLSFSSPTVLALCIAACASAPTQPSGGLDIVPKANKNYTVDGRPLSFSELEALVSSEPPPKIVLEQSRQPKGAACVVMLGIKAGVPVWTRSLNGAMHEVRSKVESSDVETIDSCR